MLIAQITDTHIVEKNKYWLSEPSTMTRERLIKVVSSLNELRPKPNIVVLTGDVSDTGTFKSYCHAKEILETLQTPLFIIPGNHDCRREMRKAFMNHSYIKNEEFINYIIDDYPVHLVGLDTIVPGEAFGRLCDKRLVWLKTALDREHKKPTLIFMHHPPIKTGNKVFDSINCFTPPYFEQLIRNQNNLIGIISGHYHHFCVSSCGGKLCFISPSVSPKHYFANPKEDNHVTALELEDPAITLHQWQGENVMTSHVIYLRDHNHRIDWNTIKNKQ